MEPVNYNAIVQDHNISLRAALAKSNTLPPAGGVQLPTLTNPAAPGDVLKGKEYINQDGSVGVGTSSGGNGAATCTLTCIGGSYAEYMEYCSPYGRQTLNWWDVGETVELYCNSFVLFTGTQDATNITGSDGIELIFVDYSGSVLIYIPDAPGAALELELW